MSLRRIGVRIETVSCEHAGRRVDNYLAARLKNVPRSLIYKLLRSGQVRVNGGRVRPDYRLAAADQIRIPPVASGQRSRDPVPPSRVSALEAAILLEDEHFLVIDKPAGLACHGGTGLRYGVIEIARQMRSHAPQVDLAHRIDRDTSGCLVLSKHPGALNAFHTVVRDRSVEKRYLALLRGMLPAGIEAIDAALGTGRDDGGERLSTVVSAGKEARTVVERCEAAGPHSLVGLRLVTGRTHQIRAHAQHIGHPVAGDPRYGAPDFNEEMRTFGLNRLFLHARQIGFGAFGHSYEVTAPVPDALAAVIAALEQAGCPG